MVNIPKLISEYLIHSYIYYERGTSVISDAAYDQIVEELLDNYSKVRASDHPHKHLILKDSLKAGTGYDIKYPTIVRVTGNHLILKHGKC